MNAKETVVMTIRPRASKAKKLSKLLRDIGLNQSPYLNRLLWQEVERLSEIPANSEDALRYLRFEQAADQKDRVKVGLKLEPSLVQAINEVCEAKRVPRDLFIETFMDFLADGFDDPNGDPFNSVPSPLAKAQELIDDPYWETNGDLNIYRSSCAISDEVLRLIKNVKVDMNTLNSKTQKAKGNMP
jgi:hypothetical protein